MAKTRHKRRPHTSRSIRTISPLRPADREACEALAREYGERMLAVARRILRSEEDAADAVQDAFLSACATFDRFAGSSHVYTWLHRIVVNACLMKLRGEKRRPCTSLDTLRRELDADERRSIPKECTTSQPADGQERAEVRRLVREAIKRLPDDYRTIVIFRDIEEFDTDQTAMLLGLSRAAVKTRLYRARLALRGLLAPIFEDASPLRKTSRACNRIGRASSNPLADSSAVA